MDRADPNPFAGYLITGASSDLGHALAERIAAIDGARMMLVSRGPCRLALGEPHRTLTGLDLTHEPDLRRLEASAAEYFGGPFSVIHSVGDFWKHKPLVRTEFTEITRMIHSHYLTLCGVACALIPLMIERGGGTLTAFSCNSVAYSYPDMAPFTAAKAAVESFIRCVANEYAEFGIAANSVALPTVLTEKVLQTKPGDHARYVTPREVAEFIVRDVAAAPRILNGNTLKVFRHSPSFFNESYFGRNPRTLDIRPAGAGG